MFVANISLGAVLGYGAWLKNDLLAIAFVLLVTLVFAGLGISTLVLIVLPREYEFVVEEGLMRWGRTDRPALQRKLPLQQITRVCLR